MPDSKITALTSIGTSTDPANDPLVLVDVSDTSMAATGTTKKVTLNQLLATSPTATLASATITGDLTVDTSTLKVDSTNNRVGIGTASPAYLLDVLAAGASTVNDSFNVARFTGASAVANDFSLVGPATSQVRLNFSHPTASGNGEVGYDHSINRMRFVVSGSEQHRIDPLGVFSWLDGAGGTRMTLNSTGLGVGASPAQKLTVAGSAEITGGVVGQGALIGRDGSSGGATYSSNTGNTNVNAPASGSIRFNVNNGTFAGVFDSNANLGIGVTPSAGKGCLQLSSGINFPATQVASSDANTLDDYEEGTWTIGLTFGGASTGITAAANQGKYTKVGRKVTVTGYLGLSSKGSATGDAVITGLPFNITNSTENYSAASLHLTSISFADYPMAYGSIGTGNITLQESTNAGVRTNLTNADFANNSEIILSFTYFV